MTVSELVGYLRVDSAAWRRGLGRGRASLERLGKDSSGGLGKLADKTDRAAAGFVRLAVAISNVATAAAAAQGAAGAVAGLGGALAVLPALGWRSGWAWRPATVGVAGFGDALKDSSNPEKFAESLERLSPAARETAIAVRDLGPAWRSVQQATRTPHHAPLERGQRGFSDLLSTVAERGGSSYVLRTRRNVPLTPLTTSQ